MLFHSSSILLPPPSYSSQLLHPPPKPPPNSSYILLKGPRWLISSYKKRFQCYSTQKSFLGGWRKRLYTWRKRLCDIAIIASSSRSRSLEFWDGVFLSCPGVTWTRAWQYFNFFLESVVFYSFKCNIFSDKSDSRISDVCSFVCPIGAFQLVFNCSMNFLFLCSTILQYRNQYFTVHQL